MSFTNLTFDDCPVYRDRIHFCRRLRYLICGSSRRGAWAFLMSLLLLSLFGCQSPGTVSFYNHKPLILPAPAQDDPMNSSYPDQNKIVRGQTAGSAYDFPRIENSIASLPVNSAPSINTGGISTASSYTATNNTPYNTNANQTNNNNSAYNNVNPISQINPNSGYSSEGGKVTAVPAVAPYPMISVPSETSAPAAVAPAVAAPIAAAPAAVAPTAAAPTAAAPTAVAPVSSVTSSGMSTPASGLNNSYGSPSTAQPGVQIALNNLNNNGTVTTPPLQNNLPQFARNSYDKSLENVETNTQGQIVQKSSPSASSRPEPKRQSLTDKVQVEKELETKYQQWLKSQKTAQKEKKAKSNNYLEPLSDDRAVFTDPNSPFARKAQSGKDKRFVREITAADLSMMSDVSSKKELLDWEKEEAPPVDWSKYSAKTLWSKWRDFAGMSPNEKEATVVMREAAAEHAKYEDDKNKKHLTKASDLYEKAGRRWPDSVLEEDALFYAGECCFFSENYPRAMRCYKQLVSKYANSVLKKQAIERLYYIGCYWVKCSEETSFSIVNLTDEKKPAFSSFAGAKKAFEAVYLNDTSDNGRAPDALFALANAYMRRAANPGDASYESAARYYRQLYEFYPASKHTEKAYQLAIIALHKSYRGPSYDSRSLKQATEIAKAAQNAGKGDQKLIQEELDNIKGEQAAQMMFRGKYYEKRGNYASARAYYNRLVRDFPDHELSQDAAKRYAEIKDRPAEVDQYAWIRPIMPFIPKNDNVYYEDHPENQVRAAIVQMESLKKNALDQSPTEKFSDLDKTKSENNKKLY